jgi:acyl-CoA thioester hydrolase
MGETLSRLRVRYVETDQMGVVHHSSYLAWLEVARTEYLRERGIPYRTLEERGIRMPVLAVKVRYLSPARYDDELLLKARLAEGNGLRFRFTYDILREADGTLLCTAETQHAATDLHGRPRRVPKDLLALIGGNGDPR